MATQLDTGRVKRLSVGNNNRIERINPVNKATEALNVAKNLTKKKITFNFVCMVIVAGALDVLGFFVDEVPFVGAGISIISDLIFITWFYFAGIKFNAKKITSMGVTSILEDIPIVGNMPFITLNVIYSYYSS